MNYSVIAAGDSFNDIAMLLAANVGIFFRAPDAVKKQFPQFKAVESYADLMKLIRQAMAEMEMERRHETAWLDL
jgi:phosphoserine/homoserine phosphotransferase